MHVLGVLKGRLAGGAVDPDHTLALVVEGGGMRSVFAAGMAEGLQHLGLDKSFQSYHGSSAGAIIAAYAAARQADVCAEIFCNEAASSRFINPLRFFVGKPIMDLRWMVHHVFRDLKPLDIDRIVRQRLSVSIVATSLKRKNATVFSNFRVGTDVLNALEASGLLPLIAGYSVGIGEDKFVDGGISQRIALESAIESGATHILLLLTQNWRDAKPATASMREWFEARILNICYGPEIEQLYLQRSDRIRAVLEGMTLDGRYTLDGVEIQAVFPDHNGFSVGRLTTDPSRLRAGRAAGKSAIAALFG